MTTGAGSSFKCRCGVDLDGSDMAVRVAVKVGAVAEGAIAGTIGSGSVSIGT